MTNRRADTKKLRTASELWRESKSPLPFNVWKPPSHEQRELDEVYGVPAYDLPTEESFAPPTPG